MANFAYLRISTDQQDLKNQKLSILDYCNRNYIKLGRPQTLKLDAFENEIRDYLKKGINKIAISKLIECSPSTLYLWLKRKKLYSKSYLTEPSK